MKLRIKDTEIGINWVGNFQGEFVFLLVFNFSYDSTLRSKRKGLVLLGFEFYIDTAGKRDDKDV